MGTQKKNVFLTLCMYLILRVFESYTRQDPRSLPPLEFSELLHRKQVESTIAPKNTGEGNLPKFKMLTLS